MSEVTKTDYDKLLEANERELWALTETHGRLCKLVEGTLWPRVQMVTGAELRAELAEQLHELGCEVDA